MWRVRVLSAVSMVCCLAGPSWAQAASSVLIWPIDPVLEADQQASALWLENRGNEAANLQVRVFAWSQNGFDDQYQNQREVIGSPPVARIEPGQKQLVRLTRTGDIPPGQERAYRIIIDEIPLPQPARDAAGNAAAAIRFQMRYSVPLFVYGAGLWSKPDAARERDPKTAGSPQLTWKLVSAGGRSAIEIRNQGPVHARLTDVVLQAGSRRQPLVEGLAGYVLPGASMRWALEGNLAPGTTVQGRINGAEPSQKIAQSQ